MSFKTFLAKIWTGIKSLFAKLPADVKTAIHIGVVVTENINKFVSSPIADVLTTIIPGDIDDKLKNILRAAIPEILLKLKLASDEWANMSDNSITQAGILQLQDLQPEAKAAFSHTISIFAAQALADGKLAWSDGVYALEWYYQTQYKPAA